MPGARAKITARYGNWRVPAGQRGCAPSERQVPTRALPVCIAATRIVAVIVSYPGEKRGAGIFAEKPGGTRRQVWAEDSGNSDAERVIARRCRREARRRPIATARSDVLTTCPTGPQHWARRRPSGSDPESR